jgi:hypothetical protein
MQDIKTLKRKATAILDKVARSERAFKEYEIAKGKARNKHTLTPVDPPQLVDVAHMRHRVPIWLTLEPDPSNVVGEGIQGWDEKRRRFDMVKLEDLYDIRINPRTYYPATPSEWEERIHETAMQETEDNFVRQSIARYR